MPDLSAVDPELLPLAEMMPKRSFSAETLAEDRETMMALWRSYERPTDDGISREEMLAKGPDGAPDVPVLVYRHEDAPRPTGAVLHIHGGGFVGGAAGNTERWNRVEAEVLKCVIISVEYRLAPETRHPGPVEDCYAALCWLHDKAAELGVDPSRIAVEGVSAGGALAAATCLLARDRGGPAVAFQSLVYPMLDDREAIKDPNPNLGNVAWTYQSNRFGWSSLLGEENIGGPDVSPYAAPARIGNVAGLPPTFIGTGGLDMLAPENIEYGRRLVEAGVPTDLRVYPRAFHGFDVGTARVGEEFKADRLAALGRAIGPEAA